MLEYDTEATLPYATEGEPGIGGRLRAAPEHFEVEEIPLYEASGEGDHLYVNITKTGLTTKDVQADLVRLLDLDKSQVGFAGLKDKNARTTQTLSLGIGHGDAAYVQAVVDRIEGELPVQVNWANFHRNKLKIGHLLGNRFSIVVSEPECETAECLARCHTIEKAILERGLPNYFGPQRFGHNGGNVAQGLGILNGSLKRRDKWLRKFLVGSVQSYFANLYLAERLRTKLFDRLLSGDVAKKYDTGGIFDVEDVVAEQLRYEAHEISFTAPIFGPKMRAAKGESGDIESAILGSASVSVDDFKRARVSGTRRLGRLLIDDLSVALHEAGVLLCFSLPKGAYATTVMREVMKNETGGGTADDKDSASLE